MKKKKSVTKVSKENKKYLFILNIVMVIMIALYLLIEFKYFALSEPLSTVFNFVYWCMIILTVYTLFNSDSFSNKNKTVKKNKRKKNGK